MKRVIISAVFAVFCGAVLFAQTYKDGFYFAQDPDFVNNQKNQVVIEVKGGKIASANWNIQSLNPAGSQDLKAIAKSGSVAGAVTWAGQAKATEDFLVSSQKVDTASVPNGPANVKPFFDLAKKALASSAVAKGSYKDGWYHAIASGPDGYHTRNYVLITVANGTIVDVLWNGVLVGMPQSIDPSKIVQSKKPNGYPMTGAKNAWHLQSAAVAAELVKVQNPDSIKMKSDHRPDAISGASIEINIFIDLAKQALQPAK